MKYENFAIFTLIALFLFIFFQFHLLHQSYEVNSTLNTEVLENKLSKTFLLNEVVLLNQTIENLEHQLNSMLDERNNSEKIAYLTFDDGPSNNTVAILDILKKESVPATFFVNGYEDKFADSVYKRIVKENHTLANHTFSHNYQSIYENKESFFTDFYRLEKLLMKYVDKKPTIVRLPGGSNNSVAALYGGKNQMEEILVELKNRGYHYIDWNVDSMDASGNVLAKQMIVKQVLKQSKGKTKVNILMHDSSMKTTTAEALPEIIAGLREQGYRFAKISERSPIIQFE